MILDFSSRSLIILYLTIVWIQGIYFTAFKNPFTIKAPDAILLAALNILCIWMIKSHVEPGALSGMRAHRLRPTPLPHMVQPTAAWFPERV